MKFTDVLIKFIGNIATKSYDAMLVHVKDFISDNLPEATNVRFSIPNVKFSDIENRKLMEYSHQMSLKFSYNEKQYQIVMPIIVGSSLCQTAYSEDIQTDIGYIITSSGAKMLFKNKESTSPYSIKILTRDNRKLGSLNGDLTVEYDHTSSSDELTRYQLVVKNGGVALTVSYPKRGNIDRDKLDTFSIDVCDFYAISHGMNSVEVHALFEKLFPNLSFKRIDVGKGNTISPKTEEYRNMEHIVMMLLPVLDRNIHNPQITELNDYKNKQILTPGQCIYRHISTILLSIAKKRVNHEFFNTMVAFQSHKNDKIQLLHETQVKSITQTRITTVEATRFTKPVVREVNFSQVGNICCYYTPESMDVGLRKELALFASISMYRSYSIDVIMKDMINDILRCQYTDPKNKDFKLLIHNNKKYHVTKDFYDVLRKRTKCDVRFYDVTLYETDETYIAISNGGVIGHFSYVVRDGKINEIDDVDENLWNGIDTSLPPREIATQKIERVVKWALSNNIIEFITAMEPYRESLNSKNDLSNFTHCMIHPMGVFGTLSCSVPFINHNYGVRVSYNANMVRQALDESIVNTNLVKCKKGVDMEKPIVRNRLWEESYSMIKNVKNVWVQLRMLPDNNEDALILSESASQNKFRYTVYSHKRIRVSNDVIFGVPDESDFLVNGFPIVGNYYSPEDPILSYKKSGESYFTIEYASMEAYGVLVSYNVETNGSILINFEIQRNYIRGDKLCARYSQKGVVSDVRDLGVITSGPFRGISPEIILSPFSLPTRMTMGLPMEMQAATYIVCKAFYEHGRISKQEFVDMVGPRLSKDVEVLDEKLHDSVIKTSTDPLKRISELYYYNSNAFEDHSALSDVNIYHEVNGQLTIIAPLGYMMLRHHILDKIKFSKYEPGFKYTNLLIKGHRGRLGGLKIGLQEVLALYSIGATSMLSDFSRTTQNNIKLYACISCGYIHIYDPGNTCQQCSGQPRCIVLSYAFAVFYLLMMSQNCLIRIYPAYCGKQTLLESRM